MTTTEAIAVLEAVGLTYLRQYGSNGRHLLEVRVTDAQLIALATTLARGTDTPEGKGDFMK